MINNEHKKHLLNPEGSKLSRQNNRLHEAIQIGSEAEIEARDIKLNLEGQTRQLEDIDGNVHRLQGNLSMSNRMIDVMRRHEMKSKMLLYCVIITLILGVLIIGYFVLVK
jgi:hypothetical protein